MGHKISANEAGSLVSLMATEATRQQSQNYGCVVVDNSDKKTLLHYVEKPTSYISTLINCGVYVLSKEIFAFLQEVYQRKQNVNLS